MLAGDVDHAQIGELARETLEMVAYLGGHLENVGRIRSEVDAPLLHALARGVQDGVIGVGQAIGIAIVMFGAGGESTAALIGNVVRRLAGDPAMAAGLRRDRERIPRFVEEVARLEPPFKFHYRAVRRPCELGGILHRERIQRKSQPGNIFEVRILRSVVEDRDVSFEQC